SRYLPGTCGSVLYAWSEHDDEQPAVLTAQGSTVRPFTAACMSERISAVAAAIAAHEIGGLITDMNCSLPTLRSEPACTPVALRAGGEARRHLWPPGENHARVPANRQRVAGPASAIGGSPRRHR